MVRFVGAGGGGVGGKRRGLAPSDSLLRQLISSSLMVKSVKPVKAAPGLPQLPSAKQLVDTVSSNFAFLCC